MIVTRFAPSPTGLLHLGHAYAALVAQASGDRFLLRIEDIDTGRAREDFVSAALQDLSWLGLTWPQPALRQSTRTQAYRAALTQLEGMGLIYPCFCSRKAIAEEVMRAKEAPHGPDGPVYPGTCRHLSAGARAERVASGMAYALRLDMEKAAAVTGPLSFIEHNQKRTADPKPFGDVVIARKDMPTSYHLAVVVDDAFQGVTLVTRGEDLRAAVPVQRLLQTLLELPVPAYAHHPLILDDKGRKFSKRDGAVTLQHLRESGTTPAQIRTRLGFGAAPC